MSSLGITTLSGKSGKRYEFNIYNLNSEWNSVAVVYVVAKKVSNSSGRYGYNLIYIGETEDLKARFAGHHKQACFDRNGADRLLTLREDSGTKRLVIEGDLIDNWDTPCND